MGSGNFDVTLVTPPECFDGFLQRSVVSNVDKKQQKRPPVTSYVAPPKSKAGAQPVPGLLRRIPPDAEQARRAVRHIARASLCQWYTRVARDLPWRHTNDPYAVWVSEVMLQQTRVTTVIPYYTKFLERFPTISSLAQAEEDDVLRAWSGLGYYRRARLLHRGAREVVELYGGEVPRARAHRLSLSGVGRYTAGAIGSIAFGLPEGVLDGNVMRVLARLCDEPSDLRRGDVQKVLWGQADALADGPEPGTLNQALMELGATLCSPKQPQCGSCPVSMSCKALQAGTVHLRPFLSKKKEPKELSLVALCPWWRDAEGAIWTRLRLSPGALFRGLYVPLMWERLGDEARAWPADADGAALDHGGAKAREKQEGASSHRAPCSRASRSPASTPTGLGATTDLGATAGLEATRRMPAQVMCPTVAYLAPAALFPQAESRSLVHAGEVVHVLTHRLLRVQVVCVDVEGACADRTQHHSSMSGVDWDQQGDFGLDPAAITANCRISDLTSLPHATLTEKVLRAATAAVKGQA